MSHVNLLGEPPATLLPAAPEAERLIAEGAAAVDIAARYPEFSLAWGMLAEEALAAGRPVESYAYARTGYHRGLDALRRSGWKGHGPVPWSHVPNQGFLRCLAALARAADAIGETGEAQRCWTFLADSSSEAFAELKGLRYRPGPVPGPGRYRGLPGLSSGWGAGEFRGADDLVDDIMAGGADLG